MGKPGGSHVPSSSAEFIGGRKPTGGSETSQYPQEKKETSIPPVAASERGTAQTRCIYKLVSVVRLGLREWAWFRHEGTAELQTERLAE